MLMAIVLPCTMLASLQPILPANLIGDIILSGVEENSDGSCTIREVNR